MYGAVNYPEASTADFIASVLLFDQHAAIAAITIIGLIAAALSTSDSQIFALGSELRSLLKGEEKIVLTKTRIAIVIFGGAALLLSIFSSDELVLIARVSFAGTSLLAPMVFSVVLSKRKPGIEISLATLVGLLIFLGSLFDLVPSIVGTVRLDMLLLIGLGLYSLGSFFIRYMLQNKNHGYMIKD
jgi:SSS family solute:Na+ symporter